MSSSDRRNQRNSSGARALVRLLLTVLAVVLLVFAGRLAYIYGYSIFSEAAAEEPPGRDVTVVIPDEAELWEIAGILKEAGVIRDRVVFVLEERISPFHGKIRPGSAALNTSMSPTEILAVLSGEETG